MLACARDLDRSRTQIITTSVHRRSGAGSGATPGRSPGPSPPNREPSAACAVSTSGTGGSRAQRLLLGFRSARRRRTQTNGNGKGATAAERRGRGSTPAGGRPHSGPARANWGRERLCFCGASHPSSRRSGRRPRQPLIDDSTTASAAPSLPPFTSARPRTTGDCRYRIALQLPRRVVRPTAVPWRG